jgi:hypothetical protein
MAGGGCGIVFFGDRTGRAGRLEETDLAVGERNAEMM